MVVFTGLNSLSTLLISFFLPNTFVLEFVHKVQGSSRVSTGPWLSLQETREPWGRLRDWAAATLSSMPSAGQGTEELDSPAHLQGTPS